MRFTRQKMVLNGWRHAPFAGPVLIVCGLLVPPLLANGNGSELAPPSPPQQQQIAKLIEQLGDKSFIRREKAQADLVKIGYDAIDALNAAVDHDDLEIAERARLLVKLIQVDWFVESDPPLVKSCLKNYEVAGPEDRLKYMSALSHLSRGLGVEALCRLVRYEKSAGLSKQAALLALSIPDPTDEAWPKRSKVIAKALDGCSRPGAKWLLTLAKSKSDPQGALVEWERHIAEEKAFAEQTPRASSEPYLVAMFRRQVILLETLNRREDSLNVMRKMIAFEKGNPATLVNLLEWLAKHESWALVDEVSQKYSRQFDADISLLYALADVRAIQGQGPESEKLAERAFRLTRELPMLQVHLQAAVQMQHKGRTAWAEREYKELTYSAPTSLAPMQGRLLYCEFLHDQGKEKAAADVLDELVKKHNLNVQVQRLLVTLDRNIDSINARKQYFLACALEAENKPAEALRELKKGFENDDADADLLIAMYRLTKDNEKEFKKVVKKINETAENYRAMIEASTDDPSAYNQLAWLLANTDGDPDEAIRASHKSLELKPGEAGYLDTLGHCYFAKGDFENAVAYQTRAYELDPHSGLLKKALDRFKAGLEKATQEKK